MNSFDEFVKEYFANPSSPHSFGLKSQEFVSKARRQIASLLSIKEKEVIFTSGATESNNLAIKGIASFYKNRGRHLITTKVEHASILEAFHQLEKNGFEITYLDVLNDGTVNKDMVLNALRDDTILVSIMAINNEVGSINDIDSIGKELKNYPKIFFHSDITQAVGKIPLNLEYVDLASLSLHKIHGFKGSGILIKKEYINLDPILSGGGQEFNFRSGTQNVPYIVSAAKTLRIALENLNKNYQKVDKIRNRLIEGLKSIDGIHLNSPLNGSPYIVNFSLPKKASVVVEALSKKEIYVSTKSACSSRVNSLSYVLKAMGLDDYMASNALRVSFSEDSTLEEVDIFLKELKNILDTIR